MMIGSVRAAAEMAEHRGARMLAWRLHAYERGGGEGAGSGGEGAGSGGVLGALRLEEARVPPLLAPDELLVKVRAASLNPIDLAMIGGYGAVALNAQRRLLGADGLEFPLTLGRDFCGVVVARGAGVPRELARGARVWGALPPHVTRGAHAQYVRARAAWLGLAPAALDDVECAAVPYAALSATALLRAAALPPPPAAPRVLLLGLGGAGQAALRLLAARGARVTVGAAGELAETALELGAAEALDRHAPEYRERVERGGPYAAVLDCAGLGGEEAGAHGWRFERYATLTSPLLRETDARGLAVGAVTAAARLAAQSARLPPPPSGAPACSPRVRWAFFSARADDLEMLRRLAERGQFGARVERAWGWRSARAAFERAAEGRARGKLVLDFRTDQL